MSNGMQWCPHQRLQTVVVVQFVLILVLISAVLELGYNSWTLSIKNLLYGVTPYYGDSQPQEQQQKEEKDSRPHVCYFLLYPTNPSAKDKYFLSLINQTWRPKLDNRDHFFTFLETMENETYFIPQNNTIFVSMPKIGYDVMHIKILEFFRFFSAATTPALNKCDFGVVLDGDTYVNPKAMRVRLLEAIDPQTSLWTGATGWGGNCGSFTHSSIVVSRGWLEHSQKWWPECLAYMKRYDNWTHWGDVAFSCCARKFIGVGPNHTFGFVDPNNWNVHAEIAKIDKPNPECVVLAHKVNFSTPSTLRILDSNKTLECPRLSNRTDY